MTRANILTEISDLKDRIKSKHYSAWQVRMWRKLLQKLNRQLETCNLKQTNHNQLTLIK